MKYAIREIEEREKSTKRKRRSKGKKKKREKPLMATFLIKWVFVHESSAVCAQTTKKNSSLFWFIFFVVSAKRLFESNKNFIRLTQQDKKKRRTHNFVDWFLFQYFFVPLIRNYSAKRETKSEYFWCGRVKIQRVQETNCKIFCIQLELIFCFVPFGRKLK